MSSPHHHQTNKPSPSLHSHKYNNYKLDSSNNNSFNNYSHDHHHHHHHYELEEYDDEEEEEYYLEEEEELTKAESFYECTENEEKIWTLFNSLDCSECGLMYNNKERRPQIVCANNHLLCKSCYFPLILIKIEIFVPKQYIYRIGLYLDIIEPDYDDIDAYLEMEEDVQRLTKFELYFCLCVRNYMQYVLTMYRSVEQDMKKRCEELEYKRKMRQVKKAQKESQKLSKSNVNSNKSGTLTGGTKAKMRFSFN